MFDATDSGSATFQLALPFTETVDAFPPLQPWERIPRHRALIVITAPRLRQLAREVAAARGIPIEEFYSLKRSKPIAWARFEFMWRAREMKRPNGSRRYSFPALAVFFSDNRPDGSTMDHTTVLNGVRRYRRHIRARDLDRVRLDVQEMAIIHGSR